MFLIQMILFCPCVGLSLEVDLSNLVNLIEFRTYVNSFQKQLNKDMRKIRKSSSLLLFAENIRKY